MQGSLLTIANLSIFSGTYVHVACTLDHVFSFSSAFLQSFKVHPKEVLAYGIPSKQAAKIGACRNLTGEKSDTCRFVFLLTCLPVFFENDTFPDSDQYCAFLHTNNGIRGLVNNHRFYLLSLLLILIG